MDFDAYETILESMRAPGQRNGGLPLLTSTLGLCSEAGEVADAVKKLELNSRSEDFDKIALELGDVLWYITAIAARLGVPLRVIAEKNVSKLRTRYPSGYTREACISKVDTRGSNNGT